MKNRAILYLVSLICIGLVGFINNLKPYVFPIIPFTAPIPLPSDYTVTIEGVDLGRHLFYDTILSADSTISCGSCHQQQFAFSGGPKKANPGIHGLLQKRNTPPLFNLAWHPYFFYDGRAKTLEEVTSHPLLNSTEMAMSWQLLSERLKKNEYYRQKFDLVFGQGKIDSTTISIALAQFLRTLISNNSRFDKALRLQVKLNKDEIEGFILFNDQVKGACLHCHFIDGNGLGSNFNFSNNGLIAAKSINEFKDGGLGVHTNIKNDFGKFKTPSIRNLGFTAPYMHNGSLQSLADVLHFYNQDIQQSINLDSKITFASKGGIQLSATELNQIKAFLRTLNDSNFISNPAFSNPFK